VSPIDRLEVGDQLDEQTTVPSRVQLFRYSAATWNPHRIHYDPAWARAEGHPDVLVQAYLHGALLQRLLLDWLDGDGRLETLGWRNTGPATADEPLHAGAEVTALDADAATVEFDVWTRTEDGTCAEGTASVRLDGAPAP